MSTFFDRVNKEADKLEQSKSSYSIRRRNAARLRLYEDTEAALVTTVARGDRYFEKEELRYKSSPESGECYTFNTVSELNALVEHMHEFTNGLVQCQVKSGGIFDRYMRCEWGPLPMFGLPPVLAPAAPAAPAPAQSTADPKKTCGC